MYFSQKRIPGNKKSFNFLFELFHCAFDSVASPLPLSPPLLKCYATLFQLRIRKKPQQTICRNFPTAILRLSAQMKDVNSLLRKFNFSPNQDFNLSNQDFNSKLREPAIFLINHFIVDDL